MELDIPALNMTKLQQQHVGLKLTLKGNTCGVNTKITKYKY